MPMVLSGAADQKGSHHVTYGIHELLRGSEQSDQGELYEQSQRGGVCERAKRVGWRKRASKETWHIERRWHSRVLSKILVGSVGNCEFQIDG